MPKVVYLNAEIFDHPGRLAALAGVAALHELVLIGARRLMVGGRLAVLRQALAPRRMVVLLVGDDLSGIERAQVDDLLNDGVVALIVAVGGTSAGPAMAWLQDDTPPDPGAGHLLGARCVRGPARLLGRRCLGSPRYDAWRAAPGQMIRTGSRFRCMIGSMNVGVIRVELE